MKKIIFSLCLLCILSTGRAGTLTNTQCGYQINYPTGSKIEVGKNISQGFYFSPTEFIDGLELNKKCSAKISLPFQPHTNLDGKYLIVLVTKNTRDQRLIQKGELVTINGKKFYSITKQDAGMCHDYIYHYYFSQANNKYYIVLFLLTAHCLGVTEDDNKQFDVSVETKDFDSLISSFKN